MLEDRRWQRQMTASGQLILPCWAAVRKISLMVRIAMAFPSVPKIETFDPDVRKDGRGERI